ncbi:MAG TPA: hypothetical protein VG734_15650 [Lacunisphaera sp.]|nr:hypothetical protein [Lacunisphaera sp.]
MKDPVFQKLKDDAGLVLSEFIFAITHRAGAREWSHPRAIPPSPEVPKVTSIPAPESGLCYFHLN